MSTDLAIAYPDETLEEALRTKAQRGVGRLPVVEPGNPTRLIGLLRRSDLIEAFRQQEDPARSPMPILDIGAWGGTRFIELVIAADAPAANRAVRDLAPSLPPDTLIVAIRRARTGQVLLPLGRTVLQPGDVVIILTRPEHDRAARKPFEASGTTPGTPASEDAGDCAERSQG